MERWQEQHDEEDVVFPASPARAGDSSGSSSHSSDSSGVTHSSPTKRSAPPAARACKRAKGTVVPTLIARRAENALDSAVKDVLGGDDHRARLLALEATALPRRRALPTCKCRLRYAPAHFCVR